MRLTVVTPAAVTHRTEWEPAPWDDRVSSSLQPARLLRLPEARRRCFKNHMAHEPSEFATTGELSGYTENNGHSMRNETPVFVPLRRSGMTFEVHKE